MNRALDSPPGNIVMWRRLSKLTDIRLGFNMSMKMTYVWVIESFTVRLRFKANRHNTEIKVGTMVVISFLFTSYLILYILL